MSVVAMAPRACQARGSEMEADPFPDLFGHILGRKKGRGKKEIYDPY